MSKRIPLYLNFLEGKVVEFSEDDVSESFLPMSGIISTTNNTATTLKTITVPDDTRGLMTVYLVCNEDDGSEGMVGAKLIHWKSSGGTASVVNSGTIVADNKEGLTTATWSVDATSNTLRIRVTGETSKNITWIAMYQIKHVLTTILP
jgi:hypothetical protein